MPEGATASIADRHGRKQGWLRLHAWRAAGALGALARWRRVRWDEVDRLVFVCAGNICRSAYAEARATALGAAATSFGLLTRGGASSPAPLLDAARGRGVDLAPHRSRGAVDVALRRGDLVLAMEPSQARAVAGAAAAAGAQVTLLGIWGPECWPHLQDPYGLSPAYHRVCVERIDAAVADVVGRAPGARRAAGTDGAR